MTTAQLEISEKEIQNAEKVLVLLSKINGISYEQQTKSNFPDLPHDRPDIFVINEPDTSLKLILDVEEDIVVCFIEITDFNELPEGLGEELLKINHGAVHGAYTISENKLYFKSNLEIENLDLNELEAAISSVFFTVYNSSETILKYFGGEEIIVED